MERGRVPARRLLERAHELALLRAASERASAGSGTVGLVFGEAGIGKSSLVAELGTAVRVPARLLMTRCDDLTTRRTYGPLRDLVGSVGRELAEALRDATDRDRVLAALRAELSWSQRPTVLVVEDVHWADDATIDALTHLARRISRMPAFVLLTFRDDEITDDHPMASLLGQLATAPGVLRVQLGPLSRSAVRELAAESIVDADRLFDVTAGNPFFVTEVLHADEGDAVPPTVVDLVRSRLLRLPATVRDAVEQLSVVPSAAEPWLVEAVVPGGIARLAPAEEHRLLVVTPAGVAFRHELTRRAVADLLPGARSMRLHRRVLAALLEHPDADLSRLMHHADRCADLETIARVGPEAAREATAAGAHREAAAHYRLVLRERHRFPPPRQAELLEALAVECYTIGAAQEAVDAQEAAVELRRGLEDRVAFGSALRWLSRVHWWNGDHAGAERASVDAVAVLDGVTDRRMLALALSNRAQLLALADETLASIDVGERAVALARELGDRATLSHALTNVGMSRWVRGDERGRPTVEEALRVALSAGETEHALRAYVTVCSSLLDDFSLAEAAEQLTSAIGLADRAEQLGYLGFLTLERARLHLHRAAWDELRHDVAAGLAGPSPLRWGALLALGRMHVRCGTGDGEAMLREAWDLSSGMAELQRAAPVAAGLAEAAWLRGDLAAVREIAAPVHAEAARLGSVVAEAELASWLSLAGDHPSPLRPDIPYGLQAVGRWREAAEAWRRIGAPYEHAAALAESEDAHDLLTAVDELERIGAGPLARLVRRRLRELGVRTHRGTGQATRRNPAGLTPRQVEVLVLLGRGLTNAEIADRLVLSERTVESHVAAALVKVGAANRHEAAHRAAELGIGERRPVSPTSAEVGTGY